MYYYVSRSMVIRCGVVPRMGPAEEVRLRRRGHRPPGPVRPYGRPMITPRMLADELGVTDRTIRRWLHAMGWQITPYAYFRLTEAEAEKVRAYGRERLARRARD